MTDHDGLDTTRRRQDCEIEVQDSNRTVLSRQSPKELATIDDETKMALDPTRSEGDHTL